MKELIKIRVCSPLRPRWAIKPKEQELEIKEFDYDKNLETFSGKIDGAM